VNNLGSDLISLQKLSIQYNYVSQKLMSHFKKCKLLQKYAILIKKENLIQSSNSNKLKKLNC